MFTKDEPCDQPASVTRSGSPPNAAMLRRIHRSAATVSSTPQFPEPPCPPSELSAGCARLPKAPTRWLYVTTTAPLAARFAPSYTGCEAHMALLRPP